MENSILNNLKSIFGDILGDDNIELLPETSPNDIECWDSLTQISILEAVQDEYGIVFSLDEIIEMKTVGDILKAIERKI